MLPKSTELSIKHTRMAYIQLSVRARFPCAVCHVTTRASQMMIPGRNVSPAGWTREYKGYMMAEYYTHYRTMYISMDENPDYTRGTHADHNGALFYFVEGVCGSLPCKPYIAGKELTCAVCTR